MDKYRGREYCSRVPKKYQPQGPTEAAVLAEAVDFEIAGHGVFTVLPADHAEQMKRLRRDLVSEIVDNVYAGTEGRGGKPSHWRGVSKSDLAAIVADSRGGYSEALQAARVADKAVPAKTVADCRVALANMSHGKSIRLCDVPGPARAVLASRGLVTMHTAGLVEATPRAAGYCASPSTFDA